MIYIILTSYGEDDILILRYCKTYYLGAGAGVGLGAGVGYGAFATATFVLRVIPVVVSVPPLY